MDASLLPLRPPLLLTSTKSAEIIKHASNAFLAPGKFLFINAVSNLYEATDANVEQVANGSQASTAGSCPDFLSPVSATLVPAFRKM